MSQKKTFHKPSDEQAKCALSTLVSLPDTKENQRVRQSAGKALWEYLEHRVENMINDKESINLQKRLMKAKIEAIASGKAKPLGCG